MQLPNWIHLRYVRWVTVLFGLSMIAAVTGVVRGSGTVFSARFTVIAFAFGLAAAGYGVVLSIMALVSFMERENDEFSNRFSLAMVGLLVGVPTASGWLGALGCAVLVAGFAIGRIGRKTDEARWRREQAERRAFYRRTKGKDARLDPEADRFLEPSATDLAARDRLRERRSAGAARPTTRRSAAEEARMIEGNPWWLPPDETADPGTGD